MKDKERLFRYRMSSLVNIYEIEGYCDYYYGYMLPNAGYVKWFDLMPYEEGFMLFTFRCHRQLSRYIHIKPLPDGKFHTAFLCRLGAEHVAY